MNKFAMAALLLAGAGSAAQAGGSATASMEVRFVIRAACSVQADSGAAPRVECTQGTGYQLVRQPAGAARVGDAWQIVF